MIEKASAGAPFLEQARWHAGHFLPLFCACFNDFTFPTPDVDAFHATSFPNPCHQIRIPIAVHHLGVQHGVQVASQNFGPQPCFEIESHHASRCGSATVERSRARRAALDEPQVHGRVLSGGPSTRDRIENLREELRVRLQLPHSDHDVRVHVRHHLYETR